ncbi:Deoxyuridine 5'-triphosphate nucleotidohydrolase [compost metagenome]
MSGLIVNIKRLHPYAVVPRYATELAAGFDLVAVEDVIIAPGETKLIPLGFAIEIPPGYEMQVRPRSGITLRTKLRVANSPGTVDADFRAEVGVIIDNIDRGYQGTDPYARTIDGGETLMVRHVRYGTYLIREGDRIAQGVIAPVERVTFAVVDELSETKRGSGGFGSSGTRADVSV